MKVFFLIDWNDKRRLTKPSQLLNKPIYTFVKTDKHANIKWGVRYYIPRAARRTNLGQLNLH